MNNTDIELIKELLKGAILATYDVIDLDDGGTRHSGVSLDEGFEQQWAFIEPRLTKLITNSNLTLLNRLEEQAFQVSKSSNGDYDDGLITLSALQAERNLLEEGNNA